MMENKTEFLTLIDRYLAGEASPEEEQRLLNFFGSFQDNAEWNDGLMGVQQELEEKLLARLHAKIGPGRQPVRKMAPWHWAAAAVLVLGTGLYFLRHQTQSGQQLAGNDVAPFSQHAILKTGHGKVLQLDSTRKGLLAQYANTNIHTSGNAVTYTNTAESAVVFDTLQVPAGGKPYHLKLADGSQVMVNVASAVRFPENFRKNNNEVQLIAGEAYFQIVHNAAAPLTIKAKDQVIEDIGTEFNVNTYADEPDNRTTLVAGAVKVNHQTLSPGQQAVLTANNLTVTNANITQVTAWVKGYFRFNGEDIQTVMRELARWYNIEVSYAGQPSKEGYYLKIARSMPISEVLRVLERTNSVHFKLSGRRVTVLRKK